MHDVFLERGVGGWVRLASMIVMRRVWTNRDDDDDDEKRMKNNKLIKSMRGMNACIQSI